MIRYLKPSAIFILAFFIICGCTSSSAVDESNVGAIGKEGAFVENNPEFPSKFEAKITELYRNYNLQGDFIIGLVTEDGLAFSFALNKEILAGKPSTLNNESPIYLASHSKALTGTLLKIMEEDGMIDLSNSLHDYLPELSFEGNIDTKSITVEQLLNHTHGIRSTAFVWKTAFLGYEGPDDLIQTLNSDYSFDSSHAFRYSNLGPNLASMIIDRVAGKSWKEEMENRIFHPLDMHKSSSNVSDYQLEDIRPAIQVGKDHQVYQKGFYKKDDTMAAAGGTISTINDLGKWLKFNLNQETSIVKDQQSFADLHGATTNQDRSFFTYQRHAYSLAWDLATYQGMEMLTRFGGYNGISFHLSFIPSKKMGIVAFSSENRAGRLPHLAANYAYNLLNSPSEADTLFAQEREMFAQAYERALEDAHPSEETQIRHSPAHDQLLGSYQNASGWPDINLLKTDSGYQMEWGELEGEIYQTDDNDRPFLASLGPLLRSFNVVGDSLITGSLRYTRFN